MAKTKEKKQTEIKPIEKPANLVTTNHEFLFIYDAKLSNPNGDPDNENKPRMDEEREINLVSDVRIKRFIRDYLQQYLQKNIYVTKLEGKPKQPKEILDDLTERKDTLEFKDDSNKKEFYLKNLIDLRMFGVTMAIEGSSMNFTGPIQLNWGYSLNPVTLNHSKAITTTFKSNEKAEQGSMGEDHRVNYSMLAFYGNIIAKKAEHTLLTTDDIALFDEAIIKSIPLLATRSKIGQYPRFYLRLEYNDDQFLFGDLRKLVSLELNQEKANQDKNLKMETIRDVSEVKLNVTQLSEWVKNMRAASKIKDYAFFHSTDLILKEDFNVTANR